MKYPFAKFKLVKIHEDGTLTVLLEEGDSKEDELVMFRRLQLTQLEWREPLPGVVSVIMNFVSVRADQLGTFANPMGVSYSFPGRPDQR